MTMATNRRAREHAIKVAGSTSALAVLGQVASGRHQTRQRLPEVVQKTALHRRYPLLVIEQTVGTLSLVDLLPARISRQ